MTDTSSLTSLRGKTLLTVKQKRPFQIVGVDDTRVTFVPKNGNGTERWEYRSTIEELMNLCRNKGKLSVTDVTEVYPDTRNSSYLAAIVHELTGHRFST